MVSMSASTEIVKKTKLDILLFITVFISGFLLNYVLRPSLIKHLPSVPCIMFLYFTIVDLSKLNNRNFGTVMSRQR